MDIILDSGPPVPEMGISGPQCDLAIMKGRGDLSLLKPGGVANAVMPEIKLGRL